MKRSAEPKRSRWRTMGRVALNLLLVTIIAGLVLAMWMPALVGVSSDKVAPEDIDRRHEEEERDRPKRGVVVIDFQMRSEF